MIADDRGERRGHVQTVRGLITSDQLGPTLMHEHLLCDIRRPREVATGDRGPEIALANVWSINYGATRAPGNYVLDLPDVAITEVRAMRAAGGGSIVELTCGGLRPDPEGLRKIAEETDTHVVMGCGHYVDEYQDPANRTRSVEDFAADMVRAVTEGAWGTGVHAGIIGEIGCQAPWTDLERRVMRGAVAAQGETGAAINVHPGRHPDQPQEVAEFVRDAGGAIERIIISHIDRTIFDTHRLLRLADTGCVIEFDLFGNEHSYYPLADIDMPNDAVRLRMIRALIERGHLPRVVVSHDICSRTRLTAFGGHGYGHIFANVVPLMRRRGFSEAEIQAILVDNPRRLLTFV